jgi:peptide/nickel transport system substrate-binding protein
VGSNTIGIDPGGPTNSPGNAEFYPVFEPLLIPNDNGTVSPFLATGYKTSNAGKTITLTLQKGIDFTDGTPFNASAVVYNLNRYSSPTANTECVTYFQTFSNAQAIGKYTVQINFIRPDPAFLSAISGLECGLMGSPTAIASEGAQFGYNPVGTGPFTLSSYGLTSADYVKNPHYWQKGKPYLDGINFILVGSNTTALETVQSGEAQLYLNAVPQDVINSANISNLKKVKIPGTESPGAVGFQIGTAPFNNILAREAATYAIDQGPLIQTFGYGLYKPAESFIGPGSWAYTGKTVPGYPTYNLAKAQALVKQLGGLSFTMIITNTSTSEAEGAALQAQWAAAGINVTLDPLAPSTQIGDIHTHQFQAWLSTIGGGPVPPLDPDLIAHRWLLSTSPLNQDELNDPVMDQLVNRSEAVFNHTFRKAVYVKMVEQVAKDLPWAYLWFTTTYDIEGSGLTGYIPDSDYSNFWDTSL